MSEKRHFMLTNAESSFGQGVEREAIYQALILAQKPFPRFAVNMEDNRCSLFLAYPQDLDGIPADRRQELMIIGVLCALSLIHLGTPGPYGPVLLQVALNSGNLHSLTPSFIERFHPHLANRLREWDAIGPAGAVTSFQNDFVAHHNCTAAAYSATTLSARTEESHKRIKRDMLCLRTLGLGLIHHAEFKAFCNGLSLPLSNGFSWFDVVHSLPGGSEAFFKTIFDSPSAEKIGSHLQFWHLCYRKRYGGRTIAEILSQFLAGSGIPCPQMLEAFAVNSALKRDLVQFHEIESKDYRAWLFCYAVVGRPSYPGGDKMQIHLYSGDHANFGASRGNLETALGYANIKSHQDLFWDLREQCAEVQVTEVVRLCKVYVTKEMGLGNTVQYKLKTLAGKYDLFRAECKGIDWIQLILKATYCRSRRVDGPIIIVPTTVLAGIPAWVPVLGKYGYILVGGLSPPSAETAPISADTSARNTQVLDSPTTQKSGYIVIRHPIQVPNDGIGYAPPPPPKILIPDNRDSTQFTQTTLASTEAFVLDERTDRSIQYWPTPNEEQPEQAIPSAHPTESAKSAKSTVPSMSTVPFPTHLVACVTLPNITQSLIDVRLLKSELRANPSSVSYFLQKVSVG
ncbi:hypothetical protein SISSUDRAFT_1057231 [Sistotremastrum suecicum HHB10207 ss-3]|uniref:Uncharacterized protein n=1 Tax=Sistotremastrum suecicum HHB10207 ss-3 TaxID=1314776 RepID=A0A166J0Q1_9AGAM|nr:hypothetical protein SISSUDRAFT_1057231 [Sistotremastrum suecicum HHB10207 ss-3]